MNPVLVDARNVQRSRWPNLSDEAVLDLCRRWAERVGRQAVVVFDGRAPGGLVGDRELDAWCRLVGTGGEIADDWITREAVRRWAAGETFWLVTSDRELRVRAGPVAERVIGGGTFLQMITGQG